MNKITVTQDHLKTFLGDHHFINAALAKKMGVSEGIVSGCFNRKLNRHGKPLSFSRKNIELLNQALRQIAEDLSGCKLEASDEEFATKRFINDDPAVMESLRRIGEYIRLQGLTNKVLGWNTKKCLNNISVNGPKPHVHISKEDSMRITTEIMSIAGTLAGWEVVPDGEESDNNKGTPAPVRNAWDDTSVDLTERFRLFCQEWPDGILFFRVDLTYSPAPNYTVTYDHADFLAKSFPDIHPYRDIASGLVTAVMDEPTFTRIVSMLTANGQHYDVTPMYEQ